MSDKIPSLGEFLRNYPGFDEPPYTLKILPDVKYLVKDPKEPYRRSPSLENMEGLVTEWSDYPSDMPCSFRTYQFNPGGAPLETRHPIRLNKVTWHLFPFRNTAPQTTFTHPERYHQLMHELDTAPGTYYTYHEEVSVLREGMVRRLLVGLEQHCHQSWSKLF